MRLCLGVALLASVAACSASSDADRIPDVAITEVQGFVFMDAPKADIGGVMNAMLSGMNRQSATAAAARGESSYTALVAVDSSGVVMAGESGSARSPNLMLVLTDSAWQRLKARGRQHAVDSTVSEPDFARHLVLVSWYPPSTLSGEIAYQTLGDPLLLDDTLTVKLGTVFMPARPEMPQTSAWQAKVWQIERKSAHAVKVVTDDGATPVRLAIPARHPSK